MRDNEMEKTTDKGIEKDKMGKKIIKDTQI